MGNVVVTMSRKCYVPAPGHGFVPFTNA